MAKVHYLLFLLQLLVSASLRAQTPSQPVRLELPFNSEETWAEVIPMPDSSLLIYHKISNAWNTKATFHFSKYNHRLEQVWASTTDLKPDREFVRHYNEAPFTFLLFQGNDKDEFSFVRIDMATGKLQEHTSELEEIDAVYEFNVLQGRYFIIGRSSKDGKPLLLLKNPAEEKARILPSVYGNESTFSDLHTDHENKRVDAVLSESNGRIARLQVKSFDAKGELIRNHFILQQQDKSLLHAEITPGDSTTQLLIGTYATRNLRFTQGFFTTPVASDVAQDVTFFNILQTKNFFKYLKPRREERTRQREVARIKAGKEPALQYRLLLHDLITTPAGYVLAAEVYYPTYVQNSYMQSINRTLNYRHEPDSYKRTHAVVLGFDRNGTLLWDNTFPLKDVATEKLVHAVEVARAPDGRMIMAHPKEETIYYRILDHDHYNPEETEITILTYNKDDKIQETMYPGLISWYGGNFAAFGFQRIKPAQGASRHVFYINKISF